MSDGIIVAAAKAVEDFTKKYKVKNTPRKTLRSKAAQSFDRACTRFGRRRTQRVFLRAYIRVAVAHFVSGEQRQGRRFYDGAFLFADQTAVRKELLAACIKAAREPYRAGNTDAVWCLVSATGQYPPADMNFESIRTAFFAEGIDTRKLGKPPAYIPSYVLA